MDSDDLVDVARSLWNQQLLRADGALGLAAHRAARAVDLDAVCESDRRLYALKLSRELREASVRTGRSFLGEARRIESTPMLDSYAASAESNSTPGNYATAFMVVCAAGGIDEDAALLAWGYQVVTQIAAALLRLGVIGHRIATALVAQLKPDVEGGVRELLATDGAAVSSFAPLLEIASMAHEHQYSRLFQS